METENIVDELISVYDLAIPTEGEVEEPKEDAEPCPHLQVMIDKSLAEEHEAIANYEKRAIKCEENGNEKMAEMFRELARDEKVHVAQLEKAYDMLGYSDKEVEKEGEAEAEEILEPELELDQDIIDIINAEIM